MRTEDLIKALTADHGHRAMPLDRVLLLALLGGSALTGLAFFIWIGLRPDVAAAAQTVRFLFKFVVTLALVATSLGVVTRLARPDAKLGPWGWSLLAAPVLLALAVAAELLAVPAASWWPRLVGSNATVCLTVVPLLAVAPLAGGLLALRHGAPSRPGQAGAVAGLLAGGIAATFYAANCTDDSPLFVATWYPLAIGLVSLIGGWLGRRILLW